MGSIPLPLKPEPWGGLGISHVLRTHARKQQLCVSIHGGRHTSVELKNDFSYLSSILIRSVGTQNTGKSAISFNKQYMKNISW